MLGAAMTVPFILACGPIAGYLIAKYILIKHLGMPNFVVPVCVILGFAGSGMQIFSIIQRIKQTEPK